MLELGLQIASHREIHRREFGGRLLAGARYPLKAVHRLLGLLELLRLDEQPQRKRERRFGQRPLLEKRMLRGDERPRSVDWLLEKGEGFGRVVVVHRELHSGQGSGHAQGAGRSLRQ